MARSGTTLLSALLRSQEDSMCFCPGFNEPLSCEDMGEWPHGICRKEFVQSPVLDFKKFQDESLSQILDFKQYYGLSKDTWCSIIMDSKNVNEIHTKLEEHFKETKIFGYRWNQSLCYFYEWISKGPNYLWLSIIRNPLDRACSSFEKHRWSFTDSLNSTISFAQKLQDVVNNQQFHLVYYEDLVKSPEKTIREIYDFFGCPIENINLTDIKGSNGEDFIPQSSNIQNIDQKKDGYLTEANPFDGLYQTQINRYKGDIWIHPDGIEYDVCDNTTYATFKEGLSKFSQYKRYFTE